MSDKIIVAATVVDHWLSCLENTDFDFGFMTQVRAVGCQQGKWSPDSTSI
jgi:hypothetical protein